MKLRINIVRHGLWPKVLPWSQHASYCKSDYVWIAAVITSQVTLCDNATYYM